MLCPPLPATLQIASLLHYRTDAVPVPLPYRYCTVLLQEAAKHHEYDRLRDGQGRAPGLLGARPEHSVTFVDNHDTGSSQQVGVCWGRAGVEAAVVPVCVCVIHHVVGVGTGAGPAAGQALETRRASSTAPSKQLLSGDLPRRLPACLHPPLARSTGPSRVASWDWGMPTYSRELHQGRRTVAAAGGVVCWAAVQGVGSGDS